MSGSSGPADENAPAEPDDALPDHLFRWLEAMLRRVTVELTRDSSFAFPVSGSRLRVLELIPSSGCSMTALAVRARMTKPSLGEILADLEEHGLARREPHPSDRRVWMVLQTSRGKAACTRIDAALHRVERRLERQVGSADYDAFRRVLTTLGEETV